MTHRTMSERSYHGATSRSVLILKPYHKFTELLFSKRIL